MSTTLHFQLADSMGSSPTRRHDYHRRDEQHPGRCAAGVQEAVETSPQRFRNSWNATFTLITARDHGVPPYSMSVSSSSFVKTGNFGLSPAAISSAGR